MIALRYCSLLLCLLGTATACESKKAVATTMASAAVAPSSPSAVARAAVNPDPAKVTHIVFVVKEHACECTRKKIESAQSALQQVLGNPPTIPVETLKADVEPESVEPYRQQKPMLAFPAVYFVDAKNAVVELLQGEITAEQISKAMKSHSG